LHHQKNPLALRCSVYYQFSLLRQQRLAGVWVFMGARGDSQGFFFFFLDWADMARRKAWHGIALSSKGVKRGLGWVVASEEARSGLLARLSCLGALRFGCIVLPFCSALLCLAGGVVVGSGYRWEGSGVGVLRATDGQDPNTQTATPFCYFASLFIFLAISFFGSLFVIADCD
jgi:hypothetical protein